MRICFMTSLVHPTVGGSTKFFFEVTQEIRKQGHHVTLICTDQESNKNIKVDDLIAVKKIPVPIFRTLTHTVFFGLLAFLKARKRNFDIYCFESGFIGIWLLLFKLTKKEPFVSFSMRYAWNMIRLDLRKGYVKIRQGLFPRIIWEIIFFINEVLDVRLSDKVVVLSNEAKKVWVNNGVPKTKVEVIPYGVDLEIYKPIKKDRRFLEELKIEENNKIILYVGHLDAARNSDKTIKAFSMLLEKSKELEVAESLKLIMVGSGYLEQSLKELVDKLRLSEHVIFIPHIHDRIKLNKIYNLGYLMVIPQVPGTGSIQATACGLPVVAVRNKSGLLGAIDEKILRNFVLVDSADPENISKACYELLKVPQRLNNISQKSLKLIVDYSWQTISIKLINFLEQLVGERYEKRYKN